ncbi:hypothetical protein ACH4D3_06205 [Streptomyces sp. NPDC018026]|uniref:hypothetical protein n=1 Tax=Streptomyces sp. NPDC018026 TaxID=3365031 RepID=UPI0037AF732E
MSAPVHRTSERPSAAALAAARQRREEGRAGSSSGSGTSAEQALLGLQASAGNQAAAATVQRARGRTLERTPGTGAARPGSAPGARRAPVGPTRRGSESGTQGMEADPALREQATNARRETLAAGFTPSGRTRRASDADTRPAPAGLTRRGSESGTHGMEADPALREQATNARREALAAGFTPSGRTRRASDADTRPAPAGLTRRGSESGTHGMEADPALREQATNARREALAAGFTPSGRTRRASDADTRPAPAGLTRRGSESGTHGMEADPALQEQATNARREALAAGFTPSGRTRRASDADTRPAPAGLTRRGSQSGTQGMDIDPALREQATNARREAEEAAARAARLLEEAAAAAAAAEAEREERRRTEAEAEAAEAEARERIAAAKAAAAEEDRRRRGAEAAAEAFRRRLLAGEARRAEEARPPVVVEAHNVVEEAAAHTAVEEEEEEARVAVEEVTLTPEERAARDRRIAELEARFTPSGRTRRASDAGTRPDPGLADLTRRGSEPGIRHVEVDTGSRERTDTTGDDERAAADARSEARAERLKAVAENADHGKRLLDPTDALGKGVQAPTAAGLGQDATAAAASAPKTDTTAAAQAAAQTHDASAAGVSGASLSGLTELFSGAASVADAFRNLRTALSKGSGAGYHNAHKKGKTKATDAGMSVFSTGANAGTMAKEGVKLQGVGSTVASAEASGVLSGVAGVAKAVRAAFKSKGAIGKIHGLRQLQKHNAAQSQRLLRLEAEANTAELNASFAREAVERARNDREGRTEEEWAADLRTAGAAYEATALIEARAKADFLSNARDLEDLTFATNLAKSRQVSKAVKEMGGGVMGEGLKGAGGFATVAIAATVGLASNPAGWITAAVGAGLVLTTATYKGGSAAYGRFQEAHHPELYTPEGEPIPAAKDTGDSLLHAMKFWKKITRYKRQLAAHKIYNMVSREGTDPTLRASALQLLILIKAGPTDHNLERPEWEARLTNPAEKADVIKEITDQLASS